jgi:hypothetical protein
MKLNRPLIAAAYLVALLMVLLPMIEILLSVWPLRFNQTAWRFGTVGLFSQAAMTPLVGAILLFATAFFLGHRKSLLAAGVVTGIIAVVLLATIPLFGLDAVQMRSQVRAETTRAFDISAMLAAIKLFGLFVVSALLTVGAIKAARNNAPRRAVPDNEPLLAKR